MRIIHAVIAGLLLGAGIGWWVLGHKGYETGEQKMVRVAAARAAAEPKVYRWRDGHGVLQITDKPPPRGRKYETVKLREDVNVIPMSQPSPEPAK
ncbi:MAG: DUF4124 domain-containing protein [Arenimonas sp.]